MSLLITNAGIAASIQANKLGVSYKITHIAVGLDGYIPTADQTQLKNEVAREAVSRGSVPAPGQLHFEAVFADKKEFKGKEIGYYLENGILFAVDSRGGDILSLKRSNTVITEAFELNLAGSSITNITVDIINASDATEKVSGLAKIINQKQVIAGVDDSAFLTIKKLLQRTASTLRAGVVKLSNKYNGSSETRAVTEKALSDGLSNALKTVVFHRSIGSIAKGGDVIYHLPENDMKFICVQQRLPRPPYGYSVNNLLFVSFLDAKGASVVNITHAAVLETSNATQSLIIPTGTKSIKFTLSRYALVSTVDLSTYYYLV